MARFVELHLIRPRLDQLGAACVDAADTRPVEVNPDHIASIEPLRGHPDTHSVLALMDGSRQWIAVPVADLVAMLAEPVEVPPARGRRGKGGAS